MIVLRPMRERSYVEWRGRSEQAYAQAQVQVGTWTPEEAFARAHEEYELLLPGGLATPGHAICGIVDTDSDVRVGEIWLAEHEGHGGHELFVFDFEIFEPYRRRGYGLAALQAAERVALDMDLDRISLHVFGGNDAAMALYEKAGYAITGFNMTRRLDQATDRGDRITR